MLDDEGISAIADALALAQIERIAAAIRRVAERHPSLRAAVVTGLGAFIADEAARAAGLTVVPLALTMGDAAARSVRASIGANSHGRRVAGGPSRQRDARFRRPATVVDAVLKLGERAGPPAQFESTLKTIEGIARGAACSSCPAAGCLRTRPRADRRFQRAIQPRTGWRARDGPARAPHRRPAEGHRRTAAREAIAAIEPARSPCWLLINGCADPLPTRGGDE